MSEDGKTIMGLAMLAGGGYLAYEMFPGLYYLIISPKIAGLGFMVAAWETGYAVEDVVAMVVVLGAAAIGLIIGGIVILAKS